MIRTKILATLGPASAKPEVLRSLIGAGLDAVRLNCSHSSPEYLASSVRLVRRAAAAAKSPIAVVLDLQGPRLRTGRLVGGKPVTLTAGRRVTVTTKDVLGTDRLISTNYRNLPKRIAKGRRILIDEGNLELVVLRCGADEVLCEVAVGGSLKEHKGINLPGTEVDLPAVTPKDRRDLECGLGLGVDYVALSFVKEPEDVLRVRRTIKSRGGHALVVAKIERQEAVAGMDAIIRAADGIMVARGDLAVELSAADVPVVQRRLIDRANEAGKMVIVATQMLESMITSPHPTRAEASDVANAVFEGADAVMLSAETAVGAYPVEAVRIMDDILRKAESSPYASHRAPQGLHDDLRHDGHAHALARAATSCVEESHAKAIVVFTLTGWSARVMAKYRPPVPIFALTPDRKVYQQLSMQWGLTPLLCPLDRSTDAMIQRGGRIVRAHGGLKKGDFAIITAGARARHLASNMLKLLPVG